MKKQAVFLFTTAAAIALLAGSPAAKAGLLTATAPRPSLVTPMDTFTFDYSGFNATSGVGYILGGGTTTFGTTTTLATGGVNGQSISITSSRGGKWNNDHGHVHAHHTDQFSDHDHGQWNQDHRFAV